MNEGQTAKEKFSVIFKTDIIFPGLALPGLVIFLSLSLTKKNTSKS